MVFQNYALYPHMTVRQNLAYGLKLRKLPKAEWKRRVEEVAKTLGLEELLDRKPRRSRAASDSASRWGVRSCANPKAFLMDEPLSNLDAKLRVSMRAELAKLHERLGVTTVYVTHDQVEAMTLGQRVAVLRDGLLQQVDPPQVLFHAAGEPLRGGVHRLAVDEPGGGGDRRTDASRLRVSASSCPESSPLVGAIGSVILGIRPTDFEHGRSANPELPRMRVQPRRRRGSRRREPRDLHDRRPARQRRGGARGRGRSKGTTKASCSRTSGRSSPPSSTRQAATTFGAEVELAVDTTTAALLRSRLGARRRCGAAGDRVRLSRPPPSTGSSSR